MRLRHHRAPHLAWRLLVRAIVGSLLAGCGPVAVSGSVEVPRPSQTPVRPPATQVALEASDAARARGLSEQSLVDRAALLRVTDEEVCVQLALWALPEDPSRREIERYGIRLAVDRPDGSRRLVESPAIDHARSWSEQRNRTQRSYWRGLVTTPSSVLYRAADVCFRTEGPLVDGDTEALWLVLESDQRERRFGWRFGADAVYPDGVGDGSAIQPRADDPPPPARTPTYGGGAMARRSGGLGGGQVIERVPGGHPVDAARLEQVFEARFGSMRMCLSRAAEQDPRLNRMQGFVVAEFTVGPSGVGNIRVVGNDFTPAVATCMQQHLAAMPVSPDPMRWTSLFRYVVGNGDPRRFQ